MAKGLNEAPSDGSYFGKVDFVSFVPEHRYILKRTGAFWTLGGIDARFPAQPLLDSEGKPQINHCIVYARRVRHWD
jgi:hypothetical protein